MLVPKSPSFLCLAAVLATANPPPLGGQTQTTAPVPECRKAHGAAIRATVFSPEGRLVASGDNGGEILVWEAVTGRVEHRFKSPGAAISDLAFHPNGKRLVAASFLALLMWDLDTGAQVLPLVTGLTPDSSGPYFDTVAFSPDGRFLAASENRYLKSKRTPPDSERSVTILDATTGAPLRRLAGRANMRLGFSGDGRWLAGADTDTLTVWDTQSWVVAQTLRQTPPFKFSPDGRWLAVCGRNPAMKSAGGLVQTPTGQWVSPAAAADVLVFETGVWRQPRKFVGHTTDVNGLSFSSDGRTLTSTERTTPLRGTVWDLEKGEALKTVTFQAGAPAWWVAFSPDGSRVAQGGEAGEVRLESGLDGHGLFTFPGLQELGRSGDWRLLRASVTRASSVLPADLFVAAGVQNLPQGWIYVVADVEVENHADVPRSLSAPTALFQLKKDGWGPLPALSVHPGEATEEWRLQLRKGTSVDLPGGYRIRDAAITSIPLAAHQTAKVQLVFVSPVGRDYKVSILGR